MPCFLFSHFPLAYLEWYNIIQKQNIIIDFEKEIIKGKDVLSKTKTIIVSLACIRFNQLLVWIDISNKIH